MARKPTWSGAPHGKRSGAVAIILAFVLLVLRTSAAETAHWEAFLRVQGVVDLSATRRDGSLTVSAAGQLFLFHPSGTLRPFARGPLGYVGSPGAEAYLALAQRRRVPGAGCAFPRDEVYALDVAAPGVVVVTTSGETRHFAALPAGTFPNGIAFDDVGRFGHRLLVTAAVGATTMVYAIDCRGRVRTLGDDTPRLEGGIAVAPRSFGRYGGQLIAPDEISGRIVAVDHRGRFRTIVESGLASGQDLGVESTGFVPRGFGRRGAAYLADRGTPGNPHPGTDSILRLTGEALAGDGVRRDDLLVATEGGADTIAVRCRRSCTVRRIANGPPVAHPEGHIVFVRRVTAGLRSP